MKKLLVVMILSGLVSATSADLYNPGNYITIVTSEESVTPNTAYTVSVQAGDTCLGEFSGSSAAVAKMIVTGGTISDLDLNIGIFQGDLELSANISSTAGVITIKGLFDHLVNPCIFCIASGTELFSFTVTSDASASPIVIDASSGNWGGYMAVPGPIDGYNATGPIPGSADGQYPTWTCGYKEIHALETCDYVLTGDLDDNCEVNIADLAMMAANWLINCYTDPSNPACVPK